MLSFSDLLLKLADFYQVWNRKYFLFFLFFPDFDFQEKNGK